MSRSFKKPVFKDTNRFKNFFKRQANKRARKKELSDGNFYKKVYNQYNINDFTFKEFNREGKEKLIRK
jgi:hypothetical protein